MKAIGWNPNEIMGDSVGDGGFGRLIDPTTGAGVFNPNLDPAVVGIDPLTGSLAPSGTDMSFGSAIRRQMHTNVINGDFAVLPPGGADSLIDSDPTSATYNPLPGWTWVPPADGNQRAFVAADPTIGSGYNLSVQALSVSGSNGGYIEQLIPVPTSQGQQYRVLLSAYNVSAIASIRTQFLTVDGVTGIGSEVSTSTLSGGEAKIDVGLVPTTAAYLRVRLASGILAGTGELAEVRCAFLPAEASIGLASITASDAATTEEVIVGVTIPVGTFTRSSTYRITAYGTGTNATGSSQTATFRVRVGPTTLTGNIAGSRAPTLNNGASADGFKVEFLFTIRSAGASGLCLANGETIGGPAQPFNTNAFVSAVSSTVAVDTTVENQLELTAETSGGSVTFTQALIECVMAS